MRVLQWKVWVLVGSKSFSNLTGLVCPGLSLPALASCKIAYGKPDQQASRPVKAQEDHFLRIHAYKWAAQNIIVMLYVLHLRITEKFELD